MKIETITICGGGNAAHAMIPIITRVLFSVPLVVISGSLLIENYY